jgi:hypothetical protein
LVLLVADLTASLAVDQPLPGLRLTLRGGTRPRATVIMKSSEVVAPTPGNADDPTAAGAALTIFNPDSGESGTFQLPAANWTVNSSGTMYKFKNTQAPDGPSAVKLALIKNARQVKVSARATGVTLDEPTQGSIGVVLDLGNGAHRYCVLFGPGTVSRDQPDRFSAKKAAAPVACPSGTTPPSTTTTTTSGGGTTSLPSTTTTTTVPLPSCAPPAVPAGAVAFSIDPGTTDCGGIQLNPGPVAPFSGQIDDGDGTKVRDLGLGCLYLGGPFNGLAPASIPDGTTSLLNVSSASGALLLLSSSDGTGPTDCTRGAGPGKHCSNGALGTDGNGACDTDADCPGALGACNADANCYFGAPVPIPADPEVLSTCALNVIATDACGSADLLTQTSSLSVAVNALLFRTGNAAAPCPQCVGGTCTAGQRMGLACSEGISSQGTTIECPPSDFEFLARLPITLAPLTTGTSTMTDPDGLFCDGQTHAGAFGQPDARTITQTGTPLAGGATLFETALAGNFCVPKTNGILIDTAVDLPGPGSVSVTGTLAVCLLGICL